MKSLLSFLSDYTSIFFVLIIASIPCAIAGSLVYAISLNQGHTVPRILTGTPDENRLAIVKAYEAEKASYLDQGADQDDLSALRAKYTALFQAIK